MSEAKDKARGGTAVGNRQPVGKGGGFDDPTKRGQIMARYHAMRKLEEERSEINAKINAERKALFAMGLNPHAVRHHYGLWKLDEEKRIEYGRSLVALNKAALTQLDLELPPPPKKRGRPAKPKAGEPVAAAEIAAQAPDPQPEQEPETAEQEPEAASAADETTETQPGPREVPAGRRPPLRPVGGTGGDPSGMQYPPSRWQGGAS